ncbi:MAG TPA: efflux RND transporter periplasmic adaptor subunit [Gammaproteobacteria bacterium]|nr:efflux RND transporter periplasmic adaptor subunit [Gammaproteobacteria bacterium]
MRKWIVLSLCLVAGTAMGAQTIALTDAQIDKLGVTLATPQPVTTAPGPALAARVTLPPAHDLVLSAPLDGRVEAMLVAPGDRISAGQVVARLYSPAFLALQRDFLQADSQLDLVRSEYRRDRTLYREGIIAARRWEATRSRYETTRARRAERRHSLALSGMEPGAIDRLSRDRQLSRTLDVHAPGKGVVLEKLANAGQRADGALALYRIGDMSELWLEIQAPLAMAAEAAPGHGVRVQGLPVRARLEAVGRHVDPKTQNVYLRATVTDGAQTLRPGQFVQVHIEVPVAGKAFAVPAGAVVHSAGRDYLFVRGAGGFTAQPVTVTRRGQNQAVIAEGVDGSERVAVSGIAAIKAAWAGMGGE